MTYLPAHSEAANDAALRGAPLALYDWLIYQLDTHGFTPVKISGVAAAVRMKRRTVRVALRVLVDRGYLEARGTETRSRAYRVRPNRFKGPLGDHSRPAA